jgi:archaellum biogenesis ATPase FlaH
MKGWKDLKCPDVELLEISSFLDKLEKNQMIYSGMADGDRTDWLIEGVLAKGWNMVVSGASGCGKSVFVMDMCMHLLSGKTWLGFKVQRVKRVLVFQCENPSDVVLKRLSLSMRHVDLTKEEVTKGHIVTRKTQMYDIENHKDQESIIKIAKRFDPDLIIFDSLSKYHSSDEKDPTEMTWVMDCFDKLRSRLWSSLAIIIIHHDGHNGRERGATSIKSWPEVFIGINGKSGREQKIGFRKSRATVWPDGFKVKGINYTFARINGKASQEYPVAKILRKHFPKGCNKGQLKQLLIKKIDLPRRKAEDAIELAIDSGQVYETINPRNKREKLIKA